MALSDINSRQVNIAGQPRIFDGTTTVNGTDLVITTGVGREVLTVNGTGGIATCKCWKLIKL